MLGFEFYNAWVIELQKARDKFPKQTAEHTLVALMEEVGELAQAVLHLQKEGKGSPEHVYAEAVQVATMAARVACDCGI